jgi:hypothetical protein
VEEHILGPVDPALALVERDQRPGRLEVVELLRVEVGEPLSRPFLCEVRGRKRRALSAVVPAPERRHENRAFEVGQ